MIIDNEIEDTEVVVKDIEDENLLDEAVPDEKKVTIITEFRSDEQTPKSINTMNPLSDGATAASSVSDDSSMGRREPEEEYFKLAVLAVKMMHTEIGDAEYIYEIDAHALFKQVKTCKVPFHRWHKWLETRFDELKQKYDNENRHM